MGPENVNEMKAVDFYKRSVSTNPKTVDNVRAGEFSPNKQYSFWPLTSTSDLNI